MDNKLILIAENNDELRAMAAEALLLSGFQVVTAATGTALFEFLAQGLHPRCVLVDPSISNMPSQSLLDALSVVLRNSGSALIVTSGRFDLDVIAHQCRIKWVLPKPFNLEQLVAMVINAAKAAKTG